MKFRKTLAALTLAAATTSASCNLEYVGRDAGRQYKTFYKEHEKRVVTEHAERMKALDKTVKISARPELFSCDGGLTFPGGLKTETFVFLQGHADPFTNKMSSLPAHSQALIYRVLLNLIKKARIKTVLIEGFLNNQLYFQSKEEQGHAYDTKDSFEKCVSEIASRARKFAPGLHKKEEAEDICLLNFFTQDKEGVNWQLLYTRNPDLRLTGFEVRDRMRREIDEEFDRMGKIIKGIIETSKKQESQGSQVSKHDDIDLHGIKTLLQGIKKELEDFRKYTYLEVLLLLADRISPETIRKSLSNYCGDSPMCKEWLPKAEELFLFWHKYGKYATDIRSSYAVKSMLLHSFHNTALVIGALHRDTLIMELYKIPHKYRPTVHFLEFECTNKDSFVTSNTRMLEIVDALIQNQQGKPSK